MLRPRDEGSGGTTGVVLNMTLSGDGIWNAIYSVQVFVGQDEQPISLSVDTGSSDIWLASSSCSTSACSSSHATLYDPSTSVQTGVSVNLTYLRGAASGPIVWDTFKLGPYTIPSQALAAADQVTDETLSPNFVGLLGLALPPNSLISHKIPATVSDAPDGATLQQNLFGLTPVDAVPAQRFLGLSLERPGSSRIPSLLGIGRHPSSLVPGFDPSTATFMDLVASRAGDTFWRVSVDSITAWVDGAPKPVTLSRSSVLGTIDFPVAIVDTGGSVIITTRDIANGIYGAWQIGPGSDGNYYVPCTTPMNISIGLGGLPPISLHPLDITAPPPVSTPSSDPSICLGLIQVSDALGSTADLVLGVPFLRNVYTILLSPPANATATATATANATSTSTSISISTATSTSTSSSASPLSPPSSFPSLGLIPLTDPTIALAEFHNVRVLGQPLDPMASPTQQHAAATVGKKLSVGITVLICIVGFFAACGALFAVRWWVLRRRFKRVGAGEGLGAAEHKTEGGEGEVVEMEDEDALRQRKWEEGKKKGLFYAESSTGSDWTRVDPAWVYEDRGTPVRKKKEDGEAGAEKGKDRLSMSSRSRSRSSALSMGSDAEAGHAVQDVRLAHAVGEDDGPWGTLPPLHPRSTSEMDMGATPGAAVPLLDEGEITPWSVNQIAHPQEHFQPMYSPSVKHERQPSTSSATVTFQDDLDMAGIGARGSVATSGRRVGRPRGTRPTSASGGSGGSGSWRGSKWSGEVGELIEWRGQEEAEGEAHTRPAGPDPRLES
ncbi:aspartic peptidase domain-containing protein [Gautieria morchelliformis]|nr:aspartic peptidase domain-containing protein [Gautieria morchelliformis]